MKQLLPLILYIGVMLTGCTHIAVIPRAEEYTATVYEPRHAEGFRIKARENDSTALMLEIYRPDTMRIIIPNGGFGRIACMSTTYIGLLEAAGCDDRIVAVSGRDYVSNRRVKERAADVGYEGAMDYESLIASKPEVALIYGIGGETPLAAKLDELGIPYVYAGDFEEQEPLGRAEWMVALGALGGTDARAAFRAVEEAYRPSAADTVTIMVNAPYSGNWFIPGKESYMSRLIGDAGGRMAIEQPAGTESKPADMERALPALARAEVWLNPGQAASAADLQRLVPKARFGGPVWNQTADFYESGAARPDLVLKELQQIFSGSAPDSLHYFKKIQ